MQGNCLYLGYHHSIPLKRWGGIENPSFHLFHLRGKEKKNRPSFQVADLTSHPENFLERATKDD